MPTQFTQQRCIYKYGCTSDVCNQAATYWVSNLFNEKKVVHNVSRRFKKNKRHIGYLDEKNSKNLASYKRRCADNDLKEKLKLRYLHDLFDEKAKEVYRPYVVSSYNKSQLAADRMIGKCNSTTPQNRARQYLKELQLTSIIHEKKCVFNKAMRRARNAINSFAFR